jgi:hypothetical protein
MHPFGFHSIFLMFPFDIPVLADDGKSENSKS